MPAMVALICSRDAAGNVFFAAAGKPPDAVTTADVVVFMTAQRAGGLGRMLTEPLGTPPIVSLSGGRGAMARRRSAAAHHRS